MGELLPELDSEVKNGMVEEINSCEELQRGRHFDGEKGSVRRVITDSCELVVATACFNSCSSVETEENACRVGVS